MTDDIDDQKFQDHVTTPNWIDRIREWMNNIDIKNLFLVIGWLSVPLWCIINNLKPSSCDMSKPENHNFNKYYGIIDLKNYFPTTTADECSAGIIFRPVLPQMILNSDQAASSFMTLAKNGTGKTSLRCEYFKTLSSKRYLKVSIFNEQITEYLGRFVGGMNVNESHCQTQNCLINWTENEFAQLLLSTLVTKFINTYDNLQYDWPDLSLDDKINLIAIICYYYNGLDTTQLQKFVNSLVNKNWFSKYQGERQNLEQNKYHNQQLLNHLKADLNKFSILDKDCERLHLLLIILEKEEFESQAGGKHLYGNTFRDLTQFSLFIKNYLKKTVVFVVDGVDENKYFFQNNGTNKAALESFCRSSVSQSVLAIVTAHHFYLSLFYPKVDGINIEDTIILQDKFPTHTITWNTKSLINYADYVLQEMNKNASKTRCKAFPDFKTLVDYSNQKTAKIIDQIRTPRALHHLMSALMEEMNNDANNVKNPFEATFENVNNAYRKSSEADDKKYCRMGGVRIRFGRGLMMHPVVAKKYDQIKNSCENY